ncbi:MAG: hypothetical protein AAFO95_03325 [Cyanobacteria bacterium J06600_6]
MSLDYVSSFPEANDLNSFGKAAKGSYQAQRYWIYWTDELGAWIDSNGKQVKILVKERSRTSEIAGSLTLGLTSVITGACLSLQNQVAIHANAVSIDSQAIAFAGHSGKGKSTLSTYCASCGSGFVTDDVLVVDQQGKTYPGNPRIKLYAHTAKSLGLEGGTPTEYKTFFEPQELGATIHDDLVPLKLIYLLAEPAAEIYSERLSPSQAVFELLPHSYYAYDLISVHPELFDAYTNLVQQASVRRLYYPREFEKLPQVYEFLGSEVKQL